MQQKETQNYPLSNAILSAITEGGIFEFLKLNFIKKNF